MDKSPIILVSVPMSVAEYERLRKNAGLISSGTVSGVIRHRLNMSAEPYGYGTRERVTETEHIQSKTEN